MNSKRILRTNLLLGAVALALSTLAPSIPCSAANSSGFDLGNMSFSSAQPVMSTPRSLPGISIIEDNMPIDRLPLPMPVFTPKPSDGRNSGFTSSQGFFLPDARTNLMAPQSVDMAPIPSASFKYGFADSGAAPYRGVCFTKTGSPSFGGILPPCATSSVDINIVDGPTRATGGNSIGATDGGSGSSSGTGQQGMPALPPGWIGVQNSHTGAYMGAIPPGGTLEAFFRGEYGIEPGQEAEAAWILEHQLPLLGGGWP